MHKHRRKPGASSEVFGASSVVTPMYDSRGRSFVDVPVAAGLAWVDMCRCGALRTVIKVPSFGTYYLPWKRQVEES